jgi:uncharacterized protein YyaL (SSP411 family)
VPGFKTILLQLSNAYKNKKQDIQAASSEFIAALSQMAKDVVASPELGDNTTLERSMLDEAAVGLLQMGDPIYGGFGRAPKFPNTSNLIFLLRYYDISGMTRFRDFVIFTAEKIAAGGIHDHLGGGFARYATDQKWLVPHFEKMLYDNALLSQLYSELYQITKKEDYSDITKKTLDYIMRDMTDPGGGFYSAQDADSEQEEGKFYVWKKEEIVSTLGDRTVIEMFCERYGVTQAGNFEGKNILNVQASLNSLAQKYGRAPEQVLDILEDARTKLFAAREKRVKPGLDEKILTSWNGLMISGFAKGFSISGNSKYLHTAKKAVDFIEGHIASSDGRLRRTFKGGRSKLNAYVEDYAFYVNGLIDLFAVHSKHQYLDRAIKYTDFMLQHFWDEKEGNLFFTSDDHEQLIARTKNIHDLATPSGNSVAASNLIRLYHYSYNKAYLDKAVSIMKSGARAAIENPFAFGQMLNAIYLYLKRPIEVMVITNDYDQNKSNSKMVTWLNRQFIPQGVNAIVSSSELPKLQSYPYFQGRVPEKGLSETAFVCKNFSCSLPIKSYKELEKLLTPS